ncbi:MAG: OsmC family peroxiredoxin [Candidatus Thorarchaeota archaeon]|nr:MAG: OsmC family peroxiredoxin [Candidatus Thorarchaeota archaeon]
MGEEVEPKYYPVKLVWTGGKSGDLKVEGKNVIKTGVPSGGPEETNLHSPEDLFVASATMCYMNGFVEFTRKMRIEFKSFECVAVGTLEKVGRSFEVTRIDTESKIVIGSEDIRNKIDRALELAAKYCYVGNSMKCPITHTTEVVIG